KRREPTRRLLPLVVPLLALAVVSTPVVVHLAVWSLECRYPPAEGRAQDVEAIVVFSAGGYPPQGPRRQAELDGDTLHRCLYAARLYAEGPPCPVLVSGGQASPDHPDPTGAAVMGDLLGQLGVKRSDLVLEQRSGTTYENAVECARLLEERGIRQV